MYSESSTRPLRVNRRGSRSGRPNGIGCAGPRNEGLGKGPRAGGTYRLESDPAYASGIDPEYLETASTRETRDGDTVSLPSRPGSASTAGAGSHLADSGNFTVEHFRPRSKYPELELDYANLFLSCGPEDERGPRPTCGNHKADWFEEDCHIKPAPESCAERFRFRSAGEIAGDDTPESSQDDSRC